MNKKIKYIITANKLIAIYDGKQITLNTSDERYKKVMGYISKEETEKAIDFLFPGKKIVKYTDGQFIIRGGNVYLKGETDPIHKLIADKLVSFHKNDLPYMPLIKFWKNLKKNPSEYSKEQLFRFLTVNEHPITSEGYFLAYKYVNIKDDGNVVDSYTGKFNNNIGQKPHMDRKDVEENPDKQCGPGLHVAAYEYAKSKQMIEVLVNPKHVVSIPRDHNEQKMRVTDYTVIGFGRGKYNGEFIPQKEIIERMKNGIKNNAGFSFRDMTAKQIVRVVKYVSGWKMPFNLKSKQTIIKNAEKIFIKLGYMKKDQAINIHNMTAKKIVDFVKGATGKKITNSLKSKKTIIKKAEKILEEV